MPAVRLIAATVLLLAMQAAEAEPLKLRLANRVVQRRARWLLARAERLFTD